MKLLKLMKFFYEAKKRKKKSILARDFKKFSHKVLKKYQSNV